MRQIGTLIGTGRQVASSADAWGRGQLESFIKCTNVSYESSRAESFYDIQLDVKGCKDLVASFRKFVEVERLEGENQYEAEGHGKQDAEKGFRFTALPPVLTIHLKRFEYDAVHDGMVKVNDRFAFSRRLDLDEFLSEKADRSGARPCYRLHSVLVHSGDVHGGHYYVHVSNMEGSGADAQPDSDASSDGSGEDEDAEEQGGGGAEEPAERTRGAAAAAGASQERWCCFDDDQVRVIGARQAVEDTFGGFHEHGRNSEAFNASFKRQRRQKSISNAYMLVYVREDDLDAVFRPNAANTQLLKDQAASQKAKKPMDEEVVPAEQGGSEEGEEGAAAAEVAEADEGLEEGFNDLDGSVAFDSAEAVPRGLLRRSSHKSGGSGKISAISSDARAPPSTT